MLLGRSTGFAVAPAAANGRRRKVCVAASDVARSVAIAANAVTGLATLVVLLRLRGQVRWWSARGLLRSGGGLAPSEDEIRRELAKGGARQKVEFGAATEWINASPLSFAESLRGKVVLLHFWTHGCCNCIHALDKIEEVEKFVTDEAFVVVGVHCGKFPAERDSRSVAEAVRRLNVSHPVANDVELELWKSVGAVGWPSLVLIGADGMLVKVWGGEPEPSSLASAIKECLLYFRADLNRRPIKNLSLRDDDTSGRFSSVLRYPSKLVFCPALDTLFIADTGNNRVVQVSPLTGELVRTIGNGLEGLEDGSFSHARFRRPHGLAVDEDRQVLFVADTGNHALREVHLQEQQVRTIFGNGSQGSDYSGGKSGRDQTLSSPWDVCIHDSRLFVAMAGTHQIWVSSELWKDGQKLSLRAFSGNGSERRRDARDASQAEWAQPSHLSVHSATNEFLVADAESSSIRAVKLDGERNATRTIAGGDPFFAENLFAFGDRVGKRLGLFSHPLAVAGSKLDRRTAYVADTNNHKIKSVDVITGEISALCGSGKPGSADGIREDVSFWEPGGLALSPDEQRLYVADTNNFAIRVVDLSSETATTFQIRAKK